MQKQEYCEGTTKLGKGKEHYINNLKAGDLIAFKVSPTKALSGKLKQVDGESKNYIIETKTGVKFSVTEQNILWVKTGSRWPKGVFRMLRGLGGENKNGEENKRTNKQDIQDEEKEGQA